MELNWRLQRQIIVFGVYFLIIFVPVFWISYVLLSRSHNCFDGLKNGSEEGIDCGGVECSLRCDGSYRDIRVNFVRPLKVTENYYDIFGLFENYNKDVYFPNIPYTMTFYTSEGKIMGSASGSISVLPQKKNAILLPTLYMQQEPKTVDFSLGYHKAVAFKKNLPENVSIESWTAQRGANNSLQVVGELKNPNNNTINNLSVYVMLYDDTKSVYAVSRSKVIQILGRQNIAVTFTWGDIPAPKNAEFIVVMDDY